MGTKTTTPKVAPKATASKAAPVVKPSTPKVTLRDFADAVAKLAPEMRASNVATRARVEHENLARILVGFSGGAKNLRVSCPFWSPKSSGVVKEGSYLIRDFPNAKPADVTAAVAVVLRAKGYCK